MRTCMYDLVIMQFLWLLQIISYTYFVHAFEMTWFKLRISIVVSCLSIIHNGKVDENEHVRLKKLYSMTIQFLLYCS